MGRGVQLRNKRKFRGVAEKGEGVRNPQNLQIYLMEATLVVMSSRRWLDRVAELERVQRGLRRGGEGRHAGAPPVLRRAVPGARRQEVRGRDEREGRVRRLGTVLPIDDNSSYTYWHGFCLLSEDLPNLYSKPASDALNVH